MEINKVTKELRLGKNLEQNLVDFGSEMTDKYYANALTSLAFNYYTFYEVFLHKENPMFHTVSELSGRLNELIFMTLFENSQQSVQAVAVQRIDRLRSDITKRTDALTAYIDVFKIYEYVMNRIELKYTDGVLHAEDGLVIQEILDYIFSSKDQASIQSRIKEILGQLPVRMTRKKYFDLIEDSIGLYKGSDKSSAEGFLYQLRSSAMLYEPEEMELHFNELREFSEELRQIDFDQLSLQDYQRYAGLLKEATNYIYNVTDLYISLQNMVNNLYTLALSSPYVIDNRTPAGAIVEEIHALFLEGGSRDIPESVTLLLGELEGIPEQLASYFDASEGMLHQILGSYQNVIESNMLNEVYQVLRICQRLNTNSLFVSLDDELQVEEKADEFYIISQKSSIIHELTRQFERTPSKVRRAIIASTIDKLPIFFKDTNEITDYIMTSFDNCSDAAEKAASIGLIQEIIAMN